MRPAQHTDAVDIEAELIAPCPPAALFAWTGELDAYPRWLEIVTAARRLDDESWAVDLRGTVGPFARTKRLRMVRAEHHAPARVVFERAELDGRQHSPWRLEVDIDDHPVGARLAMRLHYGGSLLGPVIERVLREEIERSRQRLLDLVTDPPASEVGGEVDR